MRSVDAANHAVGLLFLKYRDFVRKSLVKIALIVIIQRKSQPFLTLVFNRPRFGIWKHGAIILQLCFASGSKDDASQYPRKST